MTIIIDGKNAILGRLASYVAKQLLNGETVHIINAEKILITGNKRQIKEKYLARRRRGSPQHGPFFPSRPDMIVKRAVRGMLPYKTSRGQAAFKRFRVHIGVPHSVTGEKQTMPAREITTHFLYVEELAKSLGWKRSYP